MADITITGNLTADPELRFTASGQAALNFNMAENHSKKDQNGQWQDDGTTFYRVTVWGKRAETLADHLHKGASVLVSGRFRGGEFTSREGQLVKTYEVTANNVGLVPRPQRDQQGGYQQQAPQQPQQPQQGSWGSGGDWGAPQQSSTPF